MEYPNVPQRPQTLSPPRHIIKQIPDARNSQSLQPHTLPTFHLCLLYSTRRTPKTLEYQLHKRHQTTLNETPQQRHNRLLLQPIDLGVVTMDQRIHQLIRSLRSRLLRIHASEPDALKAHEETYHALPCRHDVLGRAGSFEAVATEVDAEYRACGIVEDVTERFGEAL